MLDFTTKSTKDTKDGIDELPGQVMGCAIEVHREELGPGLIEPSMSMPGAGTDAELHWVPAFFDLTPSCSSCPSW
jgi:hypothetical protein